MADGDCRGVCGIVGTRNRRQAEQDPHHLTYLLLLRASVPGYCEFHLRGGILGNREAAIGQFVF